jgi:hypothetical protein
MMGWGIPEQGWTIGPWTYEDDKLLSQYVKLHGEGRWSSGHGRQMNTKFLIFIVPINLYVGLCVSS